MNDNNQNSAVQKTGQKILSCLDGLSGYANKNHTLS